MSIHALMKKRESISVIVKKTGADSAPVLYVILFYGEGQVDAYRNISSHIINPETRVVL